MKSKVLLIALCLLTFIGCGGGGGGSDSGDSGAEPLTNNSCSVLKRVKLSSTKIIQGDTCSEQGSPVVQLELLDASRKKGFACTGTMLTSQYGLTAAHCFTDIKFAAAKIEGKFVAVQAVQIHPNAEDTESRFLNDFAIFKLTTPAAKVVAPILVSRSVNDGEKIYIFGYGQSRIGESTIGTDNVFRGGVMRVSDVDDQSIAARFFGDGSNACYGDSGGPAMIDVDGQLSLIGVVSTGSDFAKCGPGDTTLFANAQASSALNFISTYVPNFQTK